ncbi:MAG: 3' terminal RNA ribose 2'-O-methyltransferase Hen1, partial [Bacteroidetes bacterium]|nr:3' terminal RNA ribose 2'-O-methyltransferase Hen1 [Bacteroidota bacterium]
MLLTITTTHSPATDIGYLLHKSPDNLHTKKLPFGQAHVFYPEATEEKCTAALLLDVDPIGLVRKNRGTAFPLDQYVNDRPYVASSFMSVAINRVFGTLLSGTSKHRPELVNQDIPLEAKIYALPCRANESFLNDLFEPLGYDVETESYVLDSKFPEWGDSSYFTLTLKKSCSLRELLIHLYVLIPVLDNKKHYFIGEDEVEKLLQYGEGWLKDHPQKEKIAHRYFRNLRSFSRIALDRLKDGNPAIDNEEENGDLVKADSQEEALEDSINTEKRISLHKQRHKAVIHTLKEHNIATLLDLGCGEGKLLHFLKNEKSLAKIAGCDASIRSLEIAFDRLKPDEQRRGDPEIQLFQSALTYRDKRFREYEAATLVEVIEHIDVSRLSALERVVFEAANPRVVIVTTPNIEYNVLFETLPSGQFR